MGTAKLTRQICTEKHVLIQINKKPVALLQKTPMLPSMYHVCTRCSQILWHKPIISSCDIFLMTVKNMVLLRLHRQFFPKLHHGLNHVSCRPHINSPYLCQMIRGYWGLISRRSGNFQTKVTPIDLSYYGIYFPIFNWHQVKAYYLDVWLGRFPKCTLVIFFSGVIKHHWHRWAPP